MIPNKQTTMQWMKAINTEKLTTFIGMLGVIFALLSLTQRANANPEHQWEVKKDKKGVEVSTRETKTGYKAVKATVQVNGTIQDFLILLDDIAVAPQWVDHCEKVELISKPSDSERVVITTFSAPWPVKDREMVTYSLTEIDKANNAASITISDASDSHPETSNKVRMQDVRGKWTLISVSESSTIVTYEGYGEPAGNMPQWLANQLVVSSTYKTFKNLRSILEKN